MTTNQELIYRIMSLRAAENSLKDAITELSKAMPEGVEVLYCEPGKLHKPDTVYWTFRKRGEELSSTAMRGDEPGVKVMLLELPVDPRTLTLPKLNIPNDVRVSEIDYSVCCRCEEMFPLGEWFFLNGGIFCRGCADLVRE